VYKLTIGLLILGGVLLIASQLGSYQLGETEMIPTNSSMIFHVDLLRGAQILVESRGLNDSSRRIVAYALDAEEHSEYSGNVIVQDAVRSAHMAADAVDAPNNGNSYLYRVEYDSTYYIVLDNGPKAPLILRSEPQGYVVSITVLTPCAFLALYAVIPLAAASTLHIYDWRKTKKRAVDSKEFSA